uniref:Serpentine receptor class gamma n=1 Tax=Panagrolaimus sp. JU765 TaxID=591449 RepID=A0AC34R4M5_9BILA
MVSQFTAGILSLFFNFYVAAKLFLNRNLRSDKNVTKQEAKLVIFTFMNFICQLSLVIFEICLISFKDPNILEFLYNAFDFITDFSALAPAYFMLIVNRKLRQHLAETFCLKTT